MSALFDRHRATVLPEWLDYNGHMNEAYYVLVFSLATDTLFASLDWDGEYRRRTGRTIYTAEAHLTYLREVGVGRRLRVTTQLLDLDAKRVHLFHRMHDEGIDAPLATHELMTLSVDLADRRVAPWPDDLAAGLGTLFEAHRPLPRPEQAGRVIGIRRF